MWIPFTEITFKIVFIDFYPRCAVCVHTQNWKAIEQIKWQYRTGKRYNRPTQIFPHNQLDRVYWYGIEKIGDAFFYPLNYPWSFFKRVIAEVVIDTYDKFIINLILTMRLFHRLTIRLTVVAISIHEVLPYGRETTFLRELSSSVVYSYSIIIYPKVIFFRDFWNILGLYNSSRRPGAYVNGVPEAVTVVHV